MDSTSLTRFTGIETAAGYDREALEHYASAAMAEQDRLRKAIASEREREARAVQALAEAEDAHGLLGRMLLDGQRAIEARRGGGRRSAGGTAGKAGRESADTPADADLDDVADLADAADDAGDADDEAVAVAVGERTAWTAEDFISLRDAVMDDSPLGPRVEAV